MAAIIPIRIRFKLKHIGDLEATLGLIEKIKKSHPDTTLIVEIRVRPLD